MNERVLTGAAELLELRRVFRAAMVGLPHLTATEENVEGLHEPGRSFGVFASAEGGSEQNGSEQNGPEMLVGTTESTLGTLTLPGGTAVSHAAVTHVGVLPTHTRRGIVSTLLRRQLREARDAGEVVASLRASEAVIYGRYGYGVATSSTSAEVITARASVRDEAATSGATRIIDNDGAFDAFAGIVASHPSDRAGTISRPASWWNAARLHAKDETGPVWNAVHSTNGDDDGFVRYRAGDPSSWWSGADRKIEVEDFHAPNDAVFADLVRFLLRLDLVDRIALPALPTDTVLPLLVHDRRSVRLGRVEDETWLRILDVPAALAARTYAAGPAATIAVQDKDLPENAGTYRIASDGVSAVDADADLTVDVRELAAVLLGGTSWAGLVTAGLVTGTPDAADVLFRTARAPFAGVGF